MQENINFDINFFFPQKLNSQTYKLIIDKVKR